MINPKKKISKIKTQQFLKDYPYLFLLQQKNLTVKDWLQFKNTLEEESLKLISRDPKEDPERNQKFNHWGVLNLKNSLLKKILTTPHSSVELDLHLETSESLDFLADSDRNTLQFLCQGPNLLLGFHNEQFLRLLWKLIQSNSKFLFISCLYKRKLLNHLDIEALLNVKISVHSDFFLALDKQTEFLTLLDQSLLISPLITIPQDLIQTLSQLKAKSSMDTKESSI
jgi:hypothetical protein